MLVIYHFNLGSIESFQNLSAIYIYDGLLPAEPKFFKIEDNWKLNEWINGLMN